MDMVSFTLAFSEPFYIPNIQIFKGPDYHAMNRLLLMPISLIMRIGKESADQSEKRAFSDVLRDRKLNFLKDQRALDRFFRDRIKYNHPRIINPQKFGIQKSRSVEKKAYFASQKVAYLQQQSGGAGNRQSPEWAQASDMKREYNLRQKAQSFIQRLKKQKQYNKGKLLFLRKKEEQRKEADRIKLEAVKRKHLESLNRQKINQIMNNIMLHQQRISFRLGERLNKQMKKSIVRSKTQNSGSRYSNQPTLQTFNNQSVEHY